LKDLPHVRKDRQITASQLADLETLPHARKERQENLRAERVEPGETP